MEISTIMHFFQQGGLFMAPIALVFGVGLVIALERWVFLSIAWRQQQQVSGKLLKGIEQADSAQLLKIAQKSSTPLSKAVARCIERSGINSDRLDLERYFEEGLKDTAPRLEKRTQYLATLANIATLLGLLGTIIGLIAAFTAVASADPTQKASLLSQSISVAMNTTAFGLIVAIPLLGIHALLQSKTAQVLESFSQVGLRCVNALRAP